MSTDLDHVRRPTELDKRVFATYPQPIATAWKAIFAKAEVSERLRALQVGFLETLARTLAAALLADCLRAPRDEAAGKALQDALKSRSLGTWWGLVRALISALRARKDPAPFFVEAGPWYFKRGNRPSQAAQDITRLIEARNEASHGSQLLADTGTEDALAQSLGLARSVLESLEWFARYRIFEAHPDTIGSDGVVRGQVRRFVGEGGPVLEAASWTARLNRGCPYIQHPSAEGGTLDVSPWMTIASNESGFRVALFNRVSKGQLLATVGRKDCPALILESDGRMKPAEWPDGAPERRESYLPNRVEGVLAPEETRPRADRFELLEEVGRGGFATVFKAKDRQTGAIIALKVFSDGVPEALRVRIREEARIMQQYVHPGLLGGTLHEQGGQLMIETRLMAGSLATQVASPGWPEGRVLQLAQDVLEPLVYLHSKGKIHCDVKPSNILQDESRNVYLGDFGIAEDSKDDFGGRLGQIAGTPGYMAPEQTEGRPERRSDVYALARVLHDLRKGRVCADEQPGEGISGVLGRVLTWMGKKKARERPEAEAALQYLRSRVPGADERRQRVLSDERLGLQLRAVLEDGGHLPESLAELLAAQQVGPDRTALELWEELRRRHIRAHWPRLRNRLTVFDLLQSGARFSFLALRHELDHVPLDEGQRENLRNTPDLRDASVVRELPASVIPLDSLVECLRTPFPVRAYELSLWNACLEAFGRPPVKPQLDLAANILEQLGRWRESSAEAYGSVLREVGDLEDYRRIALPKSDGGKRWLQIPSEPLARAQRIIARRLADCSRISGRAVAFARGRSPMLHALYHAGADGAVVVDIHDYFGSISPFHLRAALQAFGGCSGWSEEGLERLMALVTVGHPTRSARFLPQGAPSSPLLANLVGCMLDAHILARIRAEPGAATWRYSRYADDLVISSPKTGHAFHESARGLLLNAIERFGWTPSPQKTRHWSSLRGAPLTLCGAIVPADPSLGPGLPREVRRRARAALHGLRAGRISPGASGLLAYAYSVTGHHAYVAGLPGRIRSHVVGLARALSPERPQEFIDDWLTDSAA